MKPVEMRWLAGIAVVALALVAIGVSRHHRHVLHPGDRLIPIQLSSLSGAPQMFAASHRPTIINVFATWCTPCRQETPGFAHAAGRLRARGFDVVAIDQQEPAAAVSAFAREFGLPYPVYIDTTGVTHSVLGARIIPMTILVNRDGVIVWEHAGPLDPGDLQAAISQTGMSG